MTSDEHEAVLRVHHGLKAIQYLMGEHTDMSILQPDYMYHLMGPFVEQLETLLRADANPSYPEGSL